VPVTLVDRTIDATTNEVEMSLMLRLEMAAAVAIRGVLGHAHFFKLTP
jgi:hypothetical protein